MDLPLNFVSRSCVEEIENFRFQVLVSSFRPSSSVRTSTANGEKERAVVEKISVEGKVHHLAWIHPEKGLGAWYLVLSGSMMMVSNQEG